MITKQNVPSCLSGPYCRLDELIRLQLNVRNFALRKNKNANALQAGDHQSRIRGRGINFEEVRHYQPGDDVRNIDWRVTARTQKTHTKVFSEEKEQPVFIIVDQRLSLFFGSRICYKSVMAAQLASMIAWATLQNNDRVGGLVFNDDKQTEIKPRKHRNAVLKLLKSIEDYNNVLSIKNNTPVSEDGLNNALLLCSKAAKSGARIFILSDFYGVDEQTEKCIRQLARHHQITSCLVYDHFETTLPEQDGVHISDGLTTLSLSVNDQKRRQKYQEIWRTKVNFLEEIHRKNALCFIKAECADDPYKILTRFAIDGRKV